MKRSEAASSLPSSSVLNPWPLPYSDGLDRRYRMASSDLTQITREKCEFRSPETTNVQYRSKLEPITCSRKNPRVDTQAPLPRSRLGIGTIYRQLALVYTPLERPTCTEESRRSNKIQFVESPSRRAIYTRILRRERPVEFSRYKVMWARSIRFLLSICCQVRWAIYLRFLPLICWHNMEGNCQISDNNFPIALDRRVFVAATYHCCYLYDICCLSGNKKIYS